MQPQAPLVPNPLTHDMLIGHVTLSKLLAFVKVSNSNPFKTLSHFIADAASCGFAFLDIGSKYTVNSETFEYFTKWGILQFNKGTFSFYPFPEES